MDPLLAYAQAHSSPETEALVWVRRQTHLRTLYPQMLSGPLQGQFLALLSRLRQPQRVLEVGTFTGYSCICLAQGLAPGGSITTLEQNAELESLIREGLHKAGLTKQVDLRLGKAADILPGLAHTWDLIFLDADKENYVLYYELMIPWLAPGGLLIADNVLWKGKVLDPEHKDKESRGIRAFNERVAADERVENVLLPLRDGLMCVWKKP